MHRFGRPLLLNKYIPDLKVPRWAWLLRVKTFKRKLQKQDKLPAKMDATDRAHKFIHGLRTTLTHAEQLRLVIDSRELCSAGLASQVFTKARHNIKRDTGNVLPRKLVLGIPLLDPVGKRAVVRSTVSTFQTCPHVPAMYREFLSKSIVCVRKSTPSVMDICQSYKPRLTTDVFEQRVQSGRWKCNCQSLHTQFGVPLVHGHVFTRNFKWLSSLSPLLRPEVFEQNMKNRLVPSWNNVSRAVSRDVQRALSELRFLTPASRAMLTASILLEAKSVYTRATANCPPKHHVSVVQDQLGLLPANFVLGPFDKGTSRLWMACEGYFYPQFHSNFYQSPTRFTEIIRSSSAEHASMELFNYLVSGAQAFLANKTDSRPPTPLCAPLHDRIGERLSQVSTLISEHNERCVTEGKPYQLIAEMSNECRTFWKQLVDQGVRKLKTGTANRARGPDALPRATPKLTRGLRTPVVRYPGVSRAVPTRAPAAPVCDCRSRVRPPPEPPPTNPPTHVHGTVARRKGRPTTGSVNNVCVLPNDVMQYICAYLGPRQTPLLLSTCQFLLYRSISFIKFTDFIWSGLQPVFKWTARVYSAIHCPIFRASVVGESPVNPGKWMTSPLIASPAPCARRQTKLYPVPNSQLLVKFKSQERRAKMKAREVLTQDKHPYRRLGKLMGRCLSLLWKEAVTVLNSNEIVAMGDILHPLKKWLSNLSEPPPQSQYQWVEFDIKEMFPEIHRTDLLPALSWIHEQLVKNKTTRGTLRFFISKDGNRKLDNCSRGARTSFHCFTFSDVVRYVLFDTFVSDCFLNLSSVLSQNTGIPIGGSCSAQLASLVLIFREKTTPLGHTLNQSKWLRYRDNFLFLLALPRDQSQSDHTLEQVRQDLKGLTGMEITLEQCGLQMRFLECMLQNPLGPHPLSLPDFVHCVSESTPPQLEKLMDPEAPGTASMLRSLVPSWVKKAAHYRLSRATARLNLTFLRHLFVEKRYPSHMWQPLLRKGALVWGLDLFDSR